MADEADTRGVKPLTSEDLESWRKVLTGHVVKMTEPPFDRFIARIDAEVAKRREAERERDELRTALFAWRRAMRSTLGSLTDTARREVHMYLSEELCDAPAANEWFESAVAAAALDREGEPTIQQKIDYEKRPWIERVGLDSGLEAEVARLRAALERVTDKLMRLDQFGLAKEEVRIAAAALDREPCTHESSSGEDETAWDDPAKVWRCDACGWRYRMVPDPTSPGTSHPVAVLDREP